MTPPPIPPASADRVLYVYWGRRGALAWLAAELATSLADAGSGDVLCYAEGNELAPTLRSFASATCAFRTFSGPAGVFTGLPRFRRDARTLVAGLRRDGFGAVIVLMPHVWTPLLGPIVHRAGLRYVVVIHDAVAHPGDRSGLATRWLLRDASGADVVVTHTKSVAARLAADRRAPHDRIVVEPHPLLAYPHAARVLRTGPLRVLFLGRILAYKGLDLLVAAVEQARAKGSDIALGVHGAGELGALAPRLRALGATVENRWLDHSGIGAILARYDVMALPYREASQSGVAMTAFGAGMPVVATPVGGLVEQIRPGIDGLIAEAATPEAFTTCLVRLAADPTLLASLTAGAAAHPGRSVAAYAARLKQLALGR